MWGALARIFTKHQPTKRAQHGGDCEVAADMDRADTKMQDTYDTKQAKQRASIKWLLSKAFNNKVPENLKEPFYRDHENQEHLKPQIVGALANAEIYCLALGNIYSDPNYHNLNHWSILQTLSRKGVFGNEPNDSQLTETTLIQTNPLKMSAHMAVVESIMLLYAKEVVTADRVLAAIQRFHHDRPPLHLPDNHEQALLYWVNHTNGALVKRIEQDDAEQQQQRQNGVADKSIKRDIPKIKELKDLCDGVALAALISYYCPDELPWSELRISYLPTVSDSLHNLGLVQDFCARCLPASIFHMQPEDVTYMRGSMKQNLVVFLADLFNLLEINPVKAVRYPGMDKNNDGGYPARNAHGVAHKRNLPHVVMSPIPDLRSGLDDDLPHTFQVVRTPTHQPLRKTNSLQHSVSEMSEDSLRRGSEDAFVVHRGKNIPTLSSVINDEPMVPARLRNSSSASNKEKMNFDTKAEERGDVGGRGLNVAAGKPSNWNENKKTFAGRRSRRNSMTDDSQLTIENFGGSQDNLNFIGRNPDKEVGVHVGRKISAPIGGMVTIENPAVRSSLQDARGTLQLGYGDDNGYDKHDTEQENYHSKLKRQLSGDDMSSAVRSLMHERNKENILQDLIDGEVNNRMSFADFNKKQVVPDPGGIQMVYMQSEKDTGFPSKSSFLNKTNNTNGNSEKKTTTFATLPNTTTWQQQSTNNQQLQQSGSNDMQPQQHHQQQQHVNDDGKGDHIMTSQLNDIRLKLEEKRRHIESEKRRMEVAMNKQRQKVGKAAFLQAVVKGKGGLVKSSSDAMVDSLMVGDGLDSSAAGTSQDNTASASGGGGVDGSGGPSRPLTLKEINDDITTVERKWMDPDAPFTETRRTPDMENMDLETYQQSISHMNSSLQDIQADIQRLASQQNQIHLAQQQQLLAQQHKQILQHQQGFQHLYNTQQSFNLPYSQASSYNTLQTSASAPHIPQSHYQQPPPRMQEPQFFLHNQQTDPAAPIPPQRRTWAQQSQPIPNDLLQQQPPPSSTAPPPQQPEMRTWGKPSSTGTSGGFLLHDNSMDRFHDNRYQNGSGDHSMNHHHHPHTNSGGYTLSQQHHLYSTSSHHSTPSTSPQHRQHRQISQLLDTSKRASPISLQSMGEPVRPERKNNVMHAPIPAPSVDDMEPQSISFIGNSDEHQISEGLSRLNITSGNRTYRIPSPTRPHITRNSFQPSPPLDNNGTTATTSANSIDNNTDPNQKGFYISFDNEQPKRPKPPLRTKKGGSPKKERSYIEDDDHHHHAQKEKEAQEKYERARQLERELEQERLKKEAEERAEKMEMSERQRRDITSQERERVNAASAIIIGNDLSNPDPDVLDERERKKERILMMSLQRRQQQEETKARKEAEIQARREKEKAKEEEKLRKKEEQAARRQAILEQHKLKKAIEEAEREGKDVDKAVLSSLKPAPKLRAKGSTTRPRPKTIHIDSESVEMAEGMLRPSRGKRGSSSNLTANSYSTSSMRRDYYRGSQDSLASSGLYKDSPDDSRGMSPSHSANQTLGRRSSYKTSRDPSPAQARGRPKYSTYQNFKGRKSNSMMNLYGSSTDQDSFAYRCGDTDSGLGRATPPRRAPSPGMGPMRHLPSPSGPGSLPGLVSKRRVFDDGSSDISSTPSSMMDYTGPRLYKQPATKSNRGIMLNAVEYCVFPGAVNKEAKHRVLEEIARSESKHFLILFRDAGCQFRALYSYCPDRDEVLKLYGTGPKQVNDRMFDKFFKYNSGGKCFAQVHTKHLTVTIDAFTIHNSLWQGKKVNLPSKKDMALVI